MSRIFKRAAYGVLAMAIVFALPVHGGEPAAERPGIETDGTIHVPSFDLPLSDILSAESRQALERTMGRTKQPPCPSIFDPRNITREAIGATRECLARQEMPLIAKLRARYDVAIKTEEIAGVYTEAITPTAGVSPENERRVLINLHGGGMVVGARGGWQIESIPIAAMGRIKVIAVDYRMAPEHRFPAAHEDIAAVYRALLKKYQPESIGIYGCSAGGRLTGQTIAWLLKEGLPLPGAIGIFCSAPAAGPYRGDSAHIVSALYGIDFAHASLLDLYYDSDVDVGNPLVFPVNAPQVLAKFPPTLLITGTRDFSLSSLVHTHAELVKQGVEADLHVWEGMGHGFFINPDLPESRDAYNVITKFFSAHLAH